MSGPNSETQLDQNQVLKRSFNETEDRIRTETVIKNGPIDVIWNSYLLSYNTNGDVSKIEYFNNYVLVQTNNFYYNSNGDLIGADKG